MNELDGTLPSTKQRRSRNVHTARQENGKQTTSAQRPTNDDTGAWKEYWAAVQPKEWFEAWGYWRIEPEIDAKRQAELDQHRAIVPDVRQGMYPFKGMKLSRADIEWLLATHENGYGPVDWNNEGQRERNGLDLRGTDLRQVDLHGLPLARVSCGLTNDEQQWASEGQCMMARANLEGSILDNAQLQGAEFHHVYFQTAQFQDTHLEQAQLVEAQLQNTCLWRVHFQQANLNKAHLERSILDEVELAAANLREAKLEGASVKRIKLGDRRHLGPFVADVQWTEVNLAVIDWSHEVVLGDEQAAYQKSLAGKKKTSSSRLVEHEVAVRANRQFAAALQAQGLNEEAKSFAYRAQCLQRIVLLRRKKFGQYLFSGFLDLLAGYGYRPGRSVIWYLVTIFVFGLTYFLIGHLPFFPDAFVFSLTSFHGRGFFPGLGSASTLHNPLVVIAAFEAVIGLVIEICFIATFTQRFFGK